MTLLNKNGFFLIELLVVLSLFVLITCLVHINISFFDRILIQTHTEKLLTTCRYLQQTAQVQNKEQELIFNEKENSYSYAGYTELFPPSVMFGSVHNSKGPPSSEHTQISKPITFTQNRIKFYPTGILSSGTVYITNQSKEYMYALSNAVSQISFLRMYFYDTKWKQL